MAEEEHVMSGEVVDLEKEARLQEREDAERGDAPVPADDVLSPSEFVEMFNPDAPAGPNGEPQYSTTSRAAFEQVWRGKGWQLRQDPYARPAEEQDQAQEAEASSEAHAEEAGAEEHLEVEAPNDKE